jgi:hypothetical protein
LEPSPAPNVPGDVLPLEWGWCGMIMNFF